MKLKHTLTIIKILLFLSITLLCLISAHKIHQKNLTLSGMDHLATNTPDENLFTQLSFFDTETGASICCFFREKKQQWYVFLPSYYDQTRFELRCSAPNISSVSLEPGDDDGLYNIYFRDANSNLILSDTLTICKSSNLPSMYINTSTGSLDYVNNNKNNTDTISTTILDEAGNLIYTNNKDSIKGHGNRSWDFDKKSYGIKFEKNIPLFDMGSSQDYVLLSNVCDNTKLQNAITYELAEQAGMPFSPKFQYIDLYFNNHYWGNYLLCEKIELSEERIPINNLSKQNKNLNKELLTATSESEFYFNTGTEKGFIVANNPADISGGYLIERDYLGKYDDENCGFITKLLNERYVLKNPNNATREQVEYISEILNNFEASLLAENEDWTSYIDINSFADKYIIEEFTQNRGGGTTSAFYYKPQDSISNLVYAGPVWDYDTAYYEAPRQLTYSALHQVSPTNVYYYLYQKPEFKDAVIKEYNRFFSNYISELGVRIDYYYTLNEASLNMDRIRWNNDKYLPKINSLKAYIEARKDFLDYVWQSDVKLCNLHFIDKEYNAEWNYSIICGETLTMPFQLATRWQNVVTGEYFDETKPIYYDQTYIAVAH